MRIFILAIFLLLAAAPCVVAQQRPPNIIVILSDDHTRQAISAYGGTLMQTPGIDRIAKEGAILQRAYVTNSICSPSRAVFYHYYEYPLSHKVAKHFGVSSDRYKLIYYYDPVKSWELFDLKKDPQEMKNVYGDPAYQKVVASMKKQLLKAAQKYKDDEAVGMLLANSY